MLTKHSAFGGLIAYGVGHIVSDIPRWKLLFPIEGLPGFLLGAFCLYWLPDRPLKNSRFNEKENEIAAARYRLEADDRVGRIQKKHVIWAITDWKLYVQGWSLPATSTGSKTNMQGTAAIYLPTASLLSSISGFLPSIVQG